MATSFGKIVLWGSIAGALVYASIKIKKSIDSKIGHGVDEKGNYNSLITNLGGIGNKVNGGMNVVFNGEKNNAVFYTNNRIAIFQGKNLVAKGSYSDGGKVIVLDNGKTVNESSVFKNLNFLLL
jgi:hypothetical protein